MVDWLLELDNPACESLLYLPLTFWHHGSVLWNLNLLLYKMIQLQLTSNSRSSKINQSARLVPSTQYGHHNRQVSPPPPPPPSPPPSSHCIFVSHTLFPGPGFCTALTHSNTLLLPAWELVPIPLMTPSFKLFWENTPCFYPKPTGSGVKDDTPTAPGAGEKPWTSQSKKPISLASGKNLCWEQSRAGEDKEESPPTPESWTALASVSLSTSEGFNVTVSQETQFAPWSRPELVSYHLHTQVFLIEKVLTETQTWFHRGGGEHHHQWTGWPLFRSHSRARIDCSNCSSQYGPPGTREKNTRNQCCITKQIQNCP